MYPKTQPLATQHRVNDLINTREIERVLRACLVEVGVVNAHAESPILLEDQDWVVQPLWMKNFHNEPSSQESGYLFPDCLTPLLVETKEVLQNRLNLGIYIKVVLSELSQYTWNVRRFPCKNVPILMDEFEVRAFLYGIQTHPNSELLGRVARREINLLGVICRFKLEGRL